MYDEDNVSETEIKWFENLKVNTGSNVPSSWKKSIASVTEDGVPVSKGFTYVEGTKNTGTVIQDSIGNEFVWIPATAENYVKDLTWSQSTNVGSLPNGITDDAADVIKYGGFYIARYEAGTPDGTESTKANSEGVPLSKQDVVIWSNISGTNSKRSAEKMISNDYVQTGLLTREAWDRTCHWMEDSVGSLTDSRSYGNYSDSVYPANVTGYGTKQKSGYSDKWCVKKIYDLARNVWEWTNERGANSLYRIYRGSSCNLNGDSSPVTSRMNCDAGYPDSNVGFRVRLYIK